MGSAGVNTEDNLKFLDLCREKGLKACVHDRRIHHALQKYENGEADWDAPLKSMTEDYKHHPALACYYVIDEPSAGMFPMLGDIVAKLKEYDPEHPGYINLLPNYATLEQLGSPTYYDHVRDYIETVRPAFASATTITISCILPTIRCRRATKSKKRRTSAKMQSAVPP